MSHSEHPITEPDVSDSDTGDHFLAEFSADSDDILVGVALEVGDAMHYLSVGNLCHLTDTQAINTQQDKHQNLIDVVRRHMLPLPLKTSEMTEEEHDRAQEDWRSLCKNTGAIRVKASASETEISELHAMHARLLEGKTGRLLIRLLMQNSKGLDPLFVTFLPADETGFEGKVTRRMHRDEIESFEGEAEELDRKFAANFPDRGGPRFLKKRTKARAAAQVNDRKHEMSEKKAQYETNDEFNEPDPGLAAQSGNAINVRGGLRDATFMQFGPSNQMIASPAFIIYGHELIHALRRRSGIISDKSGLLDWTNLEEKRTIDRDEVLVSMAKLHNGSTDDDACKSLGISDQEEWKDLLQSYGVVDVNGLMALAELRSFSENSLRADHGLPPTIKHASRLRESDDVEREAQRRRAGRPENESSSNQTGPSRDNADVEEEADHNESGEQRPGEGSSLGDGQVPTKNDERKMNLAKQTSKTRKKDKSCQVS